MQAIWSISGAGMATPWWGSQLLAAETGRFALPNSNWTTGLLFAAGVLLLTLISLRSYIRRQRHSRAEHRSPRQRLDEIKSRGSQRDTLEALMVEAQQLTRECAAQMENRALRLERLMQQADDRIRRLDSLVERGQVTGQDRRVEPRDAGELVRPESAARSRRTVEPKHLDPLTRRIYELADEGRQSVEIAQALEEHIGKVDLILALRGR